MTIAWGLAAVVMVAGTASLWLAGSLRGTGPEPVLRLQNAVQVTSSLSVESYPTWSPDGRRLAYQANEAGFFIFGNHDIWVAQVEGGEPVNLTKGSPANDRRPSWSPDGREIAFFSDRDGRWGVYTMPAIGGNPRKLLSLHAPFTAYSWNAPQWSRDGTTLFIAENESNGAAVFALSLASHETTRVALPQHESRRCWDLSVRPDGGRFAYLEAAGGDPDVTRLWTIGSSGGEAVALTDGLTRVWNPTWSADGRTIFYVSNRGGSMDLWQQAVTDDGRAMGEPISVTQGVGMTSAAFSADGARLAYAKGGKVSNVWRVPILADRASTWADATRVTSEHAFIPFVDVSPDGRQLAVSSDRRGNQDLYVLPAAGGEMTPLTTHPTPDWNPRWSPHGDELTFYAYRSGNRDIWMVPALGGPARQLTSWPGNESFPSWSPDGREIAFGAASPEGPETWITSVAEGEPRVLSPGRAEWSPDGQWLVVARKRSLFRVGKSGGGLRLLPTPHKHAPDSPRFARDGQSILYFSAFDGPLEEPDIWRLSLGDDTISRVTKLAGMRGRLNYLFSVDASYLYFIWYEDEGDIWVMDVATEDAR